MKLHFEPNLDYQHAAIESVCDLFRGQEICRTEFTVTQDFGRQMALTGMQSDLGIGNRLQLLDDEIVTNLNDIQLRNGLAPSSTLASGDFTVEMETGTGKTYVYLRTVFELNKRYGFTKFVIVVPSVAIKEGVYKTLQITEEHFRTLYANVPFEYFLYDSSKLGQVRNFATSPHIQIMVVTVGAINKKDVNNLYKDSEKTGGEKPIDLIKATRPVLIVDEPQSVDGGLEGRGKEALNAMNPLCTLRYSASFAEKLEGNTAVKVYAKLPGWFKVPTPLPIWGIEEQRGFNRIHRFVRCLCAPLCASSPRLSPAAGVFSLDPPSWVLACHVVRHLDSAGGSALMFVPAPLSCERHTRGNRDRVVSDSTRANGVADDGSGQEGR